VADAMEREHQAQLEATAQAFLNPDHVNPNDSVSGHRVQKVFSGAVDGRPPRCFFVVMDAEGNTYTAPVPVA
jgi:hypothetical protein